MDNLVLLPLGVMWAIKMVPVEVVAESRTEARANSFVLDQKHWFAAAVILLLWVAAIVATAYWVARALR